MKAKFILFSIVLLISSAFTGDHPLKMSFTRLAINADGSTELKTRIFLDDITDHLQKVYNTQQTDFSTINSNGTQLLQRYLSNYFYLKQDGMKVSLRINSIALSKNQLALVVNLSTTQPLNISKEIILVNKLLCDANSAQINNIKYLDKHYQLDLSHPEIKLETLK